MPRMQILTVAEQQAFDTPPVFSGTERETFFHVSDSLSDVLATLRSPTNRVCLVLSVGYFRVAKRFFGVPFHQADVAYVAHQLGYAPEQIDLNTYDAKASASRTHRREHAIRPHLLSYTPTVFPFTLSAPVVLR